MCLSGTGHCIRPGFTGGTPDYPCARALLGSDLQALLAVTQRNMGDFYFRDADADQVYNVYLATWLPGVDYTDVIASSDQACPPVAKPPIKSPPKSKTPPPCGGSGKLCLRGRRRWGPAQSLLPIWPPEFTLRMEGNRVLVINREGQVAARAGEEVYMSGGYVGVTDEWVLELPGDCHGPYRIVGDSELAIWRWHL